jgi:tRNA A-37 threonylcarbamoyl transferase component Bud32/tetratricopeptide (TPR) repeat protein
MKRDSTGAELHRDERRDSELESVVATALELRDAGREDWLEAACERAPELHDAVRDAVLGSSDIPHILGGGTTRDAQLGRTIGERFRLRQRLGAGAMGVVYAAEDLDLRRTVAVKLLRHGLLDANDNSQRFEREAKAMASVQHASVVTIFDRGLTPDREPFIVMERIDGASLGDVIDEALACGGDKGPLPPGWLMLSLQIDTQGEASALRTFVRWTADLAAGLAVVHAAGVLHRDIKPSNVLIRRNGQPVLLDFGIALLDGDSTLTRGVTSVGTPAYMPPEALMAGRRRSAASDVYSLTATLHHLITLQPPYEGAPNQVLAAIATRDPVPACKLRLGIPRDLQAILDKGMQRRPEARYASAAALEKDLRAFLEHQPVTARPVSALERLARRALRSHVARGMVLTLVLIALAAVVQTTRGAWLDQRRARYAELARAFPPNFTVVDPPNRQYRHEADRAALAALLDEAVDVALDPLPVRLLRASFRLDHGDPAGATNDMLFIARHVDTDYARALAARYAALPATALGDALLELAGLPAPQTALDRYLAAYHCVRSFDDARAIALLDGDEVRGLPYAEELRLACLSFEGLDALTEHQSAFAAYTDVIRLEARLGGRTATTAHYSGWLLDTMSRYDEALPILLEGIELAPRAHTIRINAGLASFALGLYDEAQRHLEVAIDLRPNYFRPLQVLVWVLLAQGRFDDAAARVAAAPLGESLAMQRWRSVQFAIIETRRALDLRRRGALDASRASTARAVALRDAAADLGAGLLIENSRSFALLEGLVANDDNAIFVALPRLMDEDPHNWWWLDEWLEHMPSSLDTAATDAVRAVFASYRRRLTSARANAALPDSSAD